MKKAMNPDLANEGTAKLRLKEEQQDKARYQELEDHLGQMDSVL